MSKKYFVRMVDMCGVKRDRTFLKAMTIQEYITFVNQKIKEIKEDCENTIERLAHLKNTEGCERIIKNRLTFAFYPIPAKGYITKSCWIDTKNLTKYIIGE